MGVLNEYFSVAKHIVFSRYNVILCKKNFDRSLFSWNSSRKNVIRANIILYIFIILLIGRLK